MRTYLKYQHPGVQFAVFIGLAVAMFLINGFIMLSFFREVVLALNSSTSNISEQALRQFKWAQFLSAIITFIIPSLVYAYLSDERPPQYLGLKRNVNLIVLFIVIFLLIAAQPFALYLGQLNQQVNFGQMQGELQKSEAFYEKAMNNFVRMNSLGDLMVNLFIVGLLPAFAEELFFRGSLQTILERWTRTPWVAILLSSCTFALLHGTVFKFLGILTLGIVLGTLFQITRNLWYNIFFHFLNNSLALITTFYASRNSMLKKFAQDDYKISLLTALISLAITIGLFILIRRRTAFQPPLSRGSNAHFDIE